MFKKTEDSSFTLPLQAFYSYSDKSGIASLREDLTGLSSWLLGTYSNQGKEEVLRFYGDCRPESYPRQQIMDPELNLLCTFHLGVDSSVMGAIITFPILRCYIKWSDFQPPKWTPSSQFPTYEHDVELFWVMPLQGLEELSMNLLWEYMANKGYCLSKLNCEIPIKDWNRQMRVVRDYWSRLKNPDKSEWIIGELSF